MAQVHGMDSLHTLLSSPMSDQDQDPNAAAFNQIMRGGQPDTTMRTAPSATNAASSSVPSAPYNYNTHQDVPKGSNTSQLTNNIEDYTMDSEPTNQPGNPTLNASYLPQTQTLYSAGAPGSTSKGTPGSNTNKPGLRLSVSNTPNVVTSVVNAFAQVTPQSNTDSPFSTSSKKQHHGIISGLKTSITSQLGISIPNFTRSNQASAPEHGILKGLSVVGGIGTAALAAGGESKAEAPTANAAPEDTRAHPSFTEPRPIVANKRVDDGDDDDVLGEGYSAPAGGHTPLSPAHSPYLQPHSRPLSPSPDGHASPNMLPPLSPYPSPGPSPQALSPLDGGLSPGAYSPGADGSGAEGEGLPSSPTGQTRGRLRGRASKSPISGPQGSVGRSQQAYVKGVSPAAGAVSRRSDAVDSRHSRHRGQSVGESQLGRGNSPYSKGVIGRQHSNSVANIAAHGASGSSGSYGARQAMQMRPTGSPHYAGHPPLEIHSGSAPATRDASLARQDPNNYNNNQYMAYPQQVQQVPLDPAYTEHFLNPPISPHSPRFMASNHVVGSPTTGLHIGTPILHSPHSLSPHSLSPHSGQFPPGTPSPDLGMPNLGYGGSSNSSPGLGLDVVATSTEIFAMDPIQAMSGNNMGMTHGAAQYTHPMYAGGSVQPSATTGMWDGLGSGSSGFIGGAVMEGSLMTQQQQPNITDGSGGWGVTAERLQAAYGPNTGAPSANGAYSVNPAPSEQDPLLEELKRSPHFWDQPPNVEGFAAQTHSPPVHAVGTPGANVPDQWISELETNYFQQGPSPPPGGMLQGAMTSEPSMDQQVLQDPSQQAMFSQYQQTASQHQHLLNTQTVPPSPAKGTLLPWSEQPAGQLPSGTVDDWSRQQGIMQGQLHVHPSIQQVMYENQALAPPVRRTPQRRRSKSDPYNLGHGPSAQEGASFPGYPPGHMHAGPNMQPTSFAPNYNPGYTDVQGGDVILGDGGGAHLKGTRSLPVVQPPRPQHKRAPTDVPTVAVSDWSNVHHSGHPSGSSGGFNHPYHAQGYGVQGTMPPPQNYNYQPQMEPYVQQPGHQHMQQQPPTFQDDKPLIQQNLTPHHPVAGPSNLARANSTKQKLQGQRNEIDAQKLQDAFKPGSHKHDPALRYLLDLILSSRFYKEDQHEPILGSADAEHILMHVRNIYPIDGRFARKNEGEYGSRTADDNEAREAQSIFMLFTENNQCLICGSQKDRTGRALGHVRSDIGHRPYHCTCEKCLQSPNPRKFFSDNLLDDHIKGQTHKQQCDICQGWFRRGGMKRHLSSKHPDQNHGQQYAQNEDGQDDL